MSQYVRVIMIEVDGDSGKPIENFSDTEEGSCFVRYGIINRKNKNRVVFSTRSNENNNQKFLSMIGEGEDDFDREEFQKEMMFRKKQHAEFESEEDLEQWEVS